MSNHSRPRPATCRTLGDGDVGVWCHYDDRSHAKALPGARWDPGLKCWRVSTLFHREAQALVDRLNGGINYELIDALETILRALPAPLRATTYKALTKVWHPDIGGDTAAMQALTAAWDNVGTDQL